MLVICSLDHAGKPHRPDERGAHQDLDGDGSLEVWEQEAELTPVVLEAASVELARLGHQVVVLAEGRYADRHARAGAIAGEHEGLVAYVALHLNAGGGDYGLAVYDSRSSGGAALAGAIAVELGGLPYLRRAIARPGASAGDWTRAWSTIRGIWSGPANLSGLCFEPLFLDTHLRGQPYPELVARLRAAGVALARGCDAWSRR